MISSHVIDKNSGQTTSVPTRPVIYLDMARAEIDLSAAMWRKPVAPGGSTTRIFSDESLRPSPPPLRHKPTPGEGTIIDDRYVLGSRIGQGGFGEVWSAEHLKLGKKVAIKVLSPAKGMEALTCLHERFRREARALARIQHPSVVSIYDFGLVEGHGCSYIAMEWLEGRDLRSELRLRGPMAPKRALSLMMTALEGLSEAHRHGIVHKDLKPENLYLADEGPDDPRLKILDFGLAHFKEARDDRLTNRQEMLGSLGYMAPEYLRDGELTLSLDVYQMALILVEMLQGHRAIPGLNTDSPAERLTRIQQSRFHLCDAVLEMPVWPVLAKALHRDPARRHPDATAFRGALAAVLEHCEMPALREMGKPREICLDIVAPKAAADEGLLAQPTVALRIDSAVHHALRTSAADFESDARRGADWRGVVLVVALVLAGLVAGFAMGLSSLPAGVFDASVTIEHNPTPKGVSVGDSDAP